MNTNETAQATENKEKFVTTFVSNGMRYTVTARPIEDSDFMSLRSYLGYKPSRVLAEDVAKHARITKQQYVTEYVTTPGYTGNILKYSTTFLQQYFNDRQTNNDIVEVQIDTPHVNPNIPIVDDDLPF